MSCDTGAITRLSERMAQLNALWTRRARVVGYQTAEGSTLVQG